jgi:hypothetical protein
MPFRQVCVQHAESSRLPLYNERPNLKWQNIGSTSTPMLKDFTGGNLGQLNDWKSRGWEVIEPEDVARVVVWLLSEDSRSVFGANINIGAAPP